MVIENKLPRSGPWSSPLLWSGLACVLLVALIVVRQFTGGLASADGGSPPLLGQVPEFQLIDQAAEPFGTEQLRSQIWVANFIFTRCPSICPKLTARMAELERRTAALERLHLVSFSVDPEYDTPEVLAEYAAGHGADTRRWSFLTGPLESVKAAIEDGLRISMGRDGEVINVNEVFHGPHFVLVDDRGRIRGYFDVEDPAGFESLIADATLLLGDAGSSERARN